MTRYFLLLDNYCSALGDSLSDKKTGQLFVRQRTVKLLSSHVKVKGILWLTVGRPVCLGVRHTSGARFHLLLYFFYLYLDNYRLVDMGRSIWREVASVVYSCYWVSPVQSPSDPSPVWLVAITLLYRAWDSPDLEGQNPVFISPRNRVAQLYPQEYNYHINSAN
jgi:hypothetical protein